MKEFVYASPILPGKTDEVIAHNRGKGKESLRVPFWEEIGLDRWHCWVQYLCEKDYLIHYLRGPSLERIFTGLREQIESGNPSALRLKAYYLEVLGKDYSEKRIEPTLEKILDLKDDSLTEEAPFERAYIYPISPEKIEAHIAYSKGAATTNKEETLCRFRAIGLAHMQKWIQYGPDGPYIVNYQKRLTPMPDKDAFDPKLFAKVKEMLIDHTKLSESEIFPTLTQVITE